MRIGYRLPSIVRSWTVSGPCTVTSAPARSTSATMYGSRGPSAVTAGIRCGSGENRAKSCGGGAGSATSQRSAPPEPTRTRPCSPGTWSSLSAAACMASRVAASAPSDSSTSRSARHRVATIFGASSSARVASKYAVANGPGAVARSASVSRRIMSPGYPPDASHDRPAAHEKRPMRCAGTSGGNPAQLVRHRLGRARPYRQPGQPELGPRAPALTRRARDLRRHRAPGRAVRRWPTAAGPGGRRPRRRP